MKAAFGDNALRRKKKGHKQGKRPPRGIKRVYVTMVPVIPTAAKTIWRRRRRQGRSIQFTAYNYGVNELWKKILPCLGTIVI
jgi:hypothetical protein